MRRLVLVPLVALAAVGFAFWRREEDPARALVDALAEAADALAAYLERIYEEAYLDTDEDDDGD